MINLELKKGMYIRTNKGKIGKIIKQIDNSGSLHHNNYVWVLDNGDVLALHSNKVKNAGFDLFDLIEVGDFLDNHCVEKIKDDTIYLNDGYFIAREDIEEFVSSIVTKEQFESCKYVIERDE